MGDVVVHISVTVLGHLSLESHMGLGRRDTLERLESIRVREDLFFL